jgi:hypothetical protein
MLEKRRQFNGYGKTQLAAEFVHRYGQFFSGGVFWLSFADAAAVTAEVAACGGMGLIDRPDFSELKLEDQLRLVLAAWQSPLPRLLVFDNCEDEALLNDWRPPTGGCHVLVTSRHAEWDAALGVQALPLDVLPREESIALLRKLRPDLAEDDVGVWQRFMRNWATEHNVNPMQLRESWSLFQSEIRSNGLALSCRPARVRRCKIAAIDAPQAVNCSAVLGRHYREHRCGLLGMKLAFIVASVVLVLSCGFGKVKHNATIQMAGASVIGCATT